MRLRPIVLALLLVTTSAFAQVPFSDPRRTGPAAYSQTNPAVASNGIDYLVAWSTAVWQPTVSMHVYATQVHSDGSVAGEIATQLDAGTSAKSAYGLSLSPGRDGYFAAWLTDTGMTAAVLDSYGRVERTAAIPQTFPDTSGHTLTAWNGSTHIVLSGFAGQGTPGFIGAYSATLLDDNATVIASNLAVGTSNFWHQALVADGSGFLVLSTRPGTGGNPDVIYGRRIAPNGSMGEWFQIRATASAIMSIAAVNDGARDVIGWSDAFGIWTIDLDPQTNAVGTSRQISPAGSSISLRMIKAGGGIWIAWSGWNSYLAYAMPLGGDGSPGIPVALGMGYPVDIAANGQAILSIRGSQPGSSQAVLGRFLPTSAADFVVSKSQTDQQNGELASDGTNVLAVWDEAIGTNREIFAARHFGWGVNADGAGVQVSSGGTNRFPAAASNGSTWLIAWLSTTSSGTFAVARRFSSSGAVIDSEDIVLGPAPQYAHPLRVAADGSSWVVAWLATRPGGGCGHGQSTRPILSRVSADGVVLDPDGVDITASIALDTADVDIAWDGSHYVAAWANYCWYGGHSKATYTVSGALISADLKETQFIPLSGALTATVLSKPRVAAIRNSAVIAWDRSGLTQYQVVNEPSTPRLARSRAVGGTPRVIRSLDGSLLGVSPSATGELMIFTIKKIPWAAYNGVFFSILAPDGTEIGSGLGAILFGEDFFTGHVARLGKYAWIADSRFDATAGAVRQWMSAMDSPR